MGKKIKITQISRHAFPFIGGVEAVIKQIFNSLPEEEFEQEIITCSNTEKSSVENGIKFNRNKFFFEFASNPISPTFIRELSKVNTDILHYHMPFIFSVIAHFIARPKYKKLVVTYHSDIVGYDKVMKPFEKIYDKFLKKADKIHVLSPQIILNSPTLKKHAEKCHVIPYGVSYSSQIEPDKLLKEKYKDKKVLFSVGRLVKYKGLIYAIEAMKYTKDNSILLIAGDGPLKEVLQEYIDNNDLNEKVKLLGKLSDKDLQSYYNLCDIYIFPSIMQSEAFGIVQLEAMSYAKPVINTNLGTGVNYVSIHNETGITVEPKDSKQLTDAINLLLDNNNLRLKYGQNARKRVEDVFDINKIKTKYAEFYKELIGKQEIVE